MASEARVLAIIPARGGSKGLPGKNKKVLDKKPLIAWTIDAAIESKVCHKVIVTTDCEEIACPKPMLKLGGQPVLEKIMLRFIQARFHKFYISTHFMPQVI